MPQDPQYPSGGQPTPPPPPPPFGATDSGYGAPSAPGVPPGYTAFGDAGAYQAPAGRSGMAVASLVLSLVGLIPFFWLLQIPGLLGMIFGFVGLAQTKNGQRSGRGLAIAGTVVGTILVIIAIVVLVVFFGIKGCEYRNDRWYCEN